MIVITPSFAPDFELCNNLHQSLLDCAPDDVHHHIIVPPSDIKLFSRLAGPRARILRETEFLPRSFVRLPFTKFTVNLSRPFPPIRGWILQQIVKLGAVASAKDDVVVLVDSDIEFIRPFSAETFVHNGTVRFFRDSGQIDESLSRHKLWHEGARKLLGLPPPKPPFTDYISSLLAWDPTIVQKMLTRVEATTGVPWTTAIGSQLHFSEWTLYGVFIDEVLGAPPFVSDDALCLNYWDPIPLDEDRSTALIEKLRPTDIAAMISAKSHTSLTARRTTFDSIRAAARASTAGA